jgi:uncharacterized membrane-anchored protein
MGTFLTIIIGAAMLYGLFTVISRERSKENKKPLGIGAVIIIVIVVLIIWLLLS